MFNPYKGLAKASIKHVQSAYPTLRKIQDITGVPWQAMAGIWYRESFSIASPKTPGGPWQFDPIPSPGALKGLLDRFTQLSRDEKSNILLAGVTDFFAGGVLAACFLRTKTAKLIFPGCPDDTIKDAIWGYNGKASGDADHATYVMNGFDEEHYPMQIVGTEPNGKGGRIQINKPDYRPGAFTVYMQLKALFP